MNKASALLPLVIFMAGCEESSPSFDLTTYEGRIAYYEHDNKTNPYCDMCMLGDSLIDYYDLNKYFPNLITKNRGIAGDKTSSLLKRLKSSIEGPNPKTLYC